MTETSPAAPARRGAFNLFDKWSQLVAVVSGLTALSGIAYNWAYFWTLGAPDLMQVLGISDQISTALSWMPAIIIAYLFNTIPSYMHGRENYNNAITKLIMAKWTPWILLVLGNIVFFTSADADWFAITGISSVFWLSVAPRIMTSHDLDKSPNVIFLFLISPAFLLFILGRANMAGLQDMTQIKGNATIQIENEDILRDISILRRLRNGIIYRDIKSQRITYMQWNPRVRITNASPTLDPHWRICYFNILCTHQDNWVTPPPAP